MTVPDTATRIHPAGDARPVEAVELDPLVRTQVIEHAARAQPEEACGILVGNVEAGCVRVRRALRCTNAAPANERNRRFEIDPRAVLNVQRELRSTANGIVGFYHSHPEGAAEPSPTDLEFMRLWPDSAWLIAGGDVSGRASLRAWWLDLDPGDAVRELPITLPMQVRGARCPD
jgi:proteasome lid subunit RPN8/RPN11